MNERKYTEEQVEEMRKDYKSLGTQRAVAKKWGVCRTTVEMYLFPNRRKRNNKNDRARRKAHPERGRAWSLKWHLDNPEKSLLIAAKSRARLYGIPLSISVDDILIPKICPVLGIVLEFGKKKEGKPRDGSPSLDRIKPELGYVKGNVRVISFKANTLKNNATVPELELVLEDLKRFL